MKPRKSHPRHKPLTDRKESVPMSAGYRMPAEWEPHAATWIAWPHNRSDWPGKFSPIPWVYAEIVRHLSSSETVCVIVRDKEMKESAQRVLAKAGAVRGPVRFFIAPTNRSWTRDYGPTFVVRESDGNVAAVKWRFNGWAKYDNHLLDEKAGQQIARWAKVPCLRPQRSNGDPVILEGGSIDVNGAGCLLTTRECLLSPVQERNPGFSQEDYENVFRDYLGVRKTIWLNRGILGDDTHGHVDDLARFVSPDTIVTVVEEDSTDPNFEPLRENLRILRAATDESGEKFRIVPIPLPQPVIFDGQRLPASYANFYIANRVVLVPTFNDPNDRIALDRLQRLFPDRKVVGICCVDLVLGLGTLHCLTQQQPAATSAK